MSIQQYLTFFRESDLRQSDLLSREFTDVYRPNVPNSVMRTWRISMNQITRESPCCEKILNIITFLDNKGLPFELIKAAAGSRFSEDDVLLAAGRLAEYSFFQVQRAVDDELPTYEQHRLVHLATRRNLTKEQATLFSGKALQVMCDLFPSGSYETWSDCALYLPHALKVAARQEAEGFKDRVSSLLQHIAYYYWEQGRSFEAERLEIEVLRLRKEALGIKHPDTIRVIANLASTWRQQGRFDEAEQLDNEVLKLQKEVLGVKHPDTITAMANLASIWRQQGRCDEAEQLEVEVEVLKVALGAARPDTIKVMSNLPYSQQGQSYEAEQVSAEVAKLLEHVTVANSSLPIEAMSSLLLDD